jgi:hypothetical protein
MNKISSQDAAALLKQAAVAIRLTVKENGELKEKNAAFENGRRVEAIARDMEDKGLSPELTFEEKVAALKESEDLRVTEAAIKLAAPQGDLLGELSDDKPGSSMHAFESFVITGEDPTS